jgi:hypothetical protein
VSEPTGFHTFAARAAQESPPWWSIPVAVALVAVLILSGIRADWRRWSIRDAVLSWRLRGLRNVLARVWLASFVLLTIALPADGAAGSAKGAIVSSMFVAGVILLGGLETVAAVSRRQEGRIDEALLRDRGLPVRRTHLSWRSVGLLCYLGGPIALTAISPILSLPLTLINDVDTQQSFAVVIAALMVLAWLTLTPWLTVRQWLRQRRSDREYWPAYRQALRERLRERPQFRV